jgi:hypothetical protein
MHMSLYKLMWSEASFGCYRQTSCLFGNQVDWSVIVCVQSVFLILQARKHARPTISSSLSPTCNTSEWKCVSEFQIPFEGFFALICINEKYTQKCKYFCPILISSGVARKTVTRQCTITSREIRTAIPPPFTYGHTDRSIEGETDGLFKMLRRVANAPKSLNNTVNVDITQHWGAFA